MITEQAIVTAIIGDLVELDVEAQSACGSCKAKSGCGTSMLATLFSRRNQRLKLPNTFDAVVGDKVIVSIAEEALVSGSLRLYLYPLLGLIAGAVLFDQFAVALALGQELFQVGGGLSGMATVLFIVSQWRRQDLLDQIQLQSLPASVADNHIQLNHLMRSFE